MPDKRAEKAVRAARRRRWGETGKVAIARFVMRTKQYLAAVRPAGRVLVLSTMLYADEVVPVDAPRGPARAGGDRPVRPRAADGGALIESLTAEAFEPERFHDTYRQRVIELIEAKAAGETLVAAPAADTGARVVDLMAALEASVKAAKERRAAGEEEPARRRRPRARRDEGAGREAPARQRPARDGRGGRRPADGPVPRPPRTSRRRPARVGRHERRDAGGRRRLPHHRRRRGPPAVALQPGQGDVPGRRVHQGAR